MNQLAGAIWRKSSYSGASTSQCVEVASNLPGVVAVRDSKNPYAGAHVVRPAAWRAFVSAVRTDRL